MASQFSGRNVGQHLTDVVTGTATQSTDIEIRIDLTKNWTEMEIEWAFTDLLNFIRQNRSPYAGEP